MTKKKKFDPAEIEREIKEAWNVLPAQSGRAYDPECHGRCEHYVVWPQERQFNTLLPVHWMWV